MVSNNFKDDFRRQSGKAFSINGMIQKAWQLVSSYDRGSIEKFKSYWLVTFWMMGLFLNTYHWTYTKWATIQLSKRMKFCHFWQDGWNQGYYVKWNKSHADNYYVTLPMRTVKEMESRMVVTTGWGEQGVEKDGEGLVSRQWQFCRSSKVCTGTGVQSLSLQCLMNSTCLIWFKHYVTYLSVKHVTRTHGHDSYRWRP